VQLLAFNDFHDNIEPPSGSSGRIGTVDAGGAEFFHTHLARLRATNRNTVVVAAGDLIGASPLTSALFHDEPTIESLNLAGLQVTSVGNHEFDEGRTELLRMQKGGCHPKDGCQGKSSFAGAKFKYLGAYVKLPVTAKETAAYKKALANATAKINTHRVFCSKKVNKRTLTCTRPFRVKLPKKPNPNRTLLPPYEIRSVGGVKIGFIGMTLEGTPQIVTPLGVAGRRLTDEAITANHTHQPYICTIANKLVTSAASFGRLITYIDLQIDTTTGDVVNKASLNNIVTRDVAKEPTQTALVAKYGGLAAPLANRVIGSITTNLTRTANAAGESALGDVIADAQLASSSPANKGGAVIAFMNPGGISADLTFTQQSGGEQPGQVTYSEAFTVQPFGNTVVVKTMTGDMLKRVLEQQFDNPSPGSDRILQVANGFSYTYDRSKPAGQRVLSMTLNGQPIVATQSDRVSLNSFLATGGDNFSVFTEGTNDLGGEVDLNALAACFAARSPVPPGQQNRIVRVG